MSASAAASAVPVPVAPGAAAAGEGGLDLGGNEQLASRAGIFVDFSDIRSALSSPHGL